MSFILDSLKKVERQRRAVRVPTIETTHVPPPQVASRRRIWPWVVGLAIVLNAAVLSIALRPEPQPSRVAAVPVPAAAPTPSHEVASTPPSTTPPPAPPAHTTERGADAPPLSKVAALPETTRPASPPDSRSTTTARTQAPPHPTPRTLPPTPTRPRLVEPMEDQARSEAREAASAAWRAVARSRASEPAPPRAVSATPAPSVPAPQASGPDPKLRLDALVYSDVAIERMVFINGHKYVEGQHVDDRIVVERITPDGAMISADGQRFLLKQ